MNDVKPHERDTPMVWQSLALFPFLNARENVEFGLKMRGMDAAKRKAKALDWLDRLGIGEFAERNVAKLSGGQRQRVALARSLVTEPKILLLDEPLSALDAHLVIRMQSVLTKLQKELGITFVYVTHSQSEAFAMADRVIIMAQGRNRPDRQGEGYLPRARPTNSSPSSSAATIFSRARSRAFRRRGRHRRHAARPLQGADAMPTRRPTVGDPLSFVVAATLCRFPRATAIADNAYRCQLISEQFVGSTVTLFLEAAGGYELKVHIGQRELESVDLKCDHAPLRQLAGRAGARAAIAEQPGVGRLLRLPDTRA